MPKKSDQNYESFTAPWKKHFERKAAELRTNMLDWHVDRDKHDSPKISMALQASMFSEYHNIIEAIFKARIERKAQYAKEGKPAEGISLSDLMQAAPVVQLLQLVRNSDDVKRLPYDAAYKEKVSCFLAGSVIKYAVSTCNDVKIMTVILPDIFGYTLNSKTRRVLPGMP